MSGIRYSLGWCGAALAVAGSAAAKNISTTIYIGRHFEVRDYDEPVKYVFNGSTRVARTTGSLASTPRFQRFHLHNRWNLLSLAVSVTNALHQITNDYRATLSASSIFRWDTAQPAWVPLLPGQDLNAEAILWLRSTSDCSLVLKGAYQEPSPREVGPLGTFEAGAGLQAWNFAGALSNVPSATAWSFDGSNGSWIATLAAPLRAQSDAWTTMAPGAAVFVRTEAPGRLELPDPASYIRYYHEDHVGSSSVMSDAAGAVAEEASYFPFGRVRNDYRAGRWQEAYAFTQKERDEESRLIYFETRYLAAHLSRFITPDRKYANPDALSAEVLAGFVCDPQALNLSAYVRNNPLKFTDPTGQDTATPKSSVGPVKGAEVTVGEDDVYAPAVRELRQHYFQSALYPGEELRRWDYSHKWDDPKDWADPSDVPYLTKRLKQENSGSVTYMFIHADATADPETDILQEATVRITIKTFYASQEAQHDRQAQFEAGVRGVEMLNYLKQHPVPKLKPQTTTAEYNQELEAYRSQMFRTIEIMHGYKPPAEKK